MSAAGWHPDPSGVPGRLRWWDGQAWTEHVHEQQAAPAPSPAAGSPLDVAVLVVGPPRPAAPGCQVFELANEYGARLGRLVDTSRGTNDSALGATLSRSKGWQHATTRELRGPRGFPELILAWGPVTPGVISVALPDRREVGRFAVAEGGWAVLGHDNRHWATASRAGVSALDGSPWSQFTPDGHGGWRSAAEAGPFEEPLRSLMAAAAVAADLL